MDKILKSYINRRGINGKSAIGKYVQTNATAMNNYIEQKQEIKNNYLSDKENQNQIEDIAEQIAKELKKIQSGLR